MTDEQPVAGTPDEQPSAPHDPVLAEIGVSMEGVDFSTFVGIDGHPHDLAIVANERYHDLVSACREAGFDAFSDLCGVDYLHRRPRYEVVTNLLDMDRVARVRIRVGVPGGDPVVASITDLFPGANFFERETYDLYGISFEGHPDLTRILMPDDWEGYPLRKDYSVGSVPVQFKGAHRAS